MESSDALKEVWRTVEAAQAEFNGVTFRHYKGKIARVIALALEEATLETVVVYVESGAVFTRPLKDWSTPVVDAGGKSVPRFAKIEQTVKPKQRDIEPPSLIYVMVEGGRNDGSTFPITTDMPQEAFIEVGGEVYRRRGSILVFDPETTAKRLKA